MGKVELTAIQEEVLLTITNDSEFYQKAIKVLRRYSEGELPWRERGAKSVRGKLLRAYAACLTRNDLELKRRRQRERVELAGCDRDEYNARFANAIFQYYSEQIYGYNRTDWQEKGSTGAPLTPVEPEFVFVPLDGLAFED